MSYEHCIGESRIDRSLTHPALQNSNEHNIEPEDAMQSDLALNLPPSGGFQNIITAMDVLFGDLIAYPTCNQDAKTIAKVIIIIMTS